MVVTLGADGAALYHQTADRAYQAHHMPALPAKARNTNGAGDCLVAGACMRLLQGATPVAALAFGLVSCQLSCLLFVPLSSSQCIRKHTEFYSKR